MNGTAEEMASQALAAVGEEGEVGQYGGGEYDESYLPLDEFVSNLIVF